MIFFSKSNYPKTGEDRPCNYCSIIIITFNEEKYLPKLLDALYEQTCKNFEIIIVDSNSTDNTVRTAKTYQEKFGNFKIIQLTQTNGPAFGRNNGVMHATYERIIFFDADTYLKPDFIQKLFISIHKKHPDVATCRIRIAEGGFVSNFGAMFLNFFMIAMHPIYSSAYGACFITTKTVHSKVDGFWEHLAVCEDCNYARRARRIHGYRFKILAPIFYTSDRRANAEGSLKFMLKYIKIHAYRIFTGKEFIKGSVTYEYGDF